MCRAKFHGRFLTLMPPSDTNIAPGVERSIYSNADMANEDEVTAAANRNRSKGKAQSSWMTDRKLRPCQIISSKEDMVDGNTAMGGTLFFTVEFSCRQ